MIKKCPICGGKILENVFDRCLLTIIERVKKAEKEMLELRKPSNGMSDAAYTSGVNDSLLVLRAILKKAR